MKKILAAAAVLSIFSASGHAAQPVITETDSAIIVEYNGNPDEKTALAPQADAAPGGSAVAAAVSFSGSRTEGGQLVKQRDELRKERAARRTARHPDHEQDPG